MSSYVAMKHVSHFLNAAKGNFCLRTVVLGGWSNHNTSANEVVKTFWWSVGEFARN